MSPFLPPSGVRTIVCYVFTFISIIFFSNASAADPQSWFTENKGQVVDQFVRQRADIKYLYIQGSFKLLLQSNSFSYEIANETSSNSVEESTGYTNPTDAEHDLSPDEHSRVTVSRVDITLKGSNPTPVIEAQEAASFYQNYYNHLTGSQGITGVKSFKKIIYHDIYPHIDLVFSISPDQNKPEYSFVLHPRSDARQIQMNYAGAGNKFFNEQDAFVMKVKEGSVYESNPVGFYENEKQHSIPLHFQINNNTVSIGPFSYSRDRTFVIDPVITWATYYGGTRLDMADEMSINSHDAVYVTGRTESSDMIATSGSYQSSYGGGKDDAFLVKFDEEGNLLWATYYGGEKLELGYCMTIDNSDHPIICGKTNSLTGIASPGAIQTTFGGGQHDSYIAKFNDDGTLQWSTYYGGEGMDRVLACTTDKYGLIYLTGYTESISQIATSGAYKTTGDIAGEAFIMKIGTDGSLLFSTYFGSKSQDRGHSIAIDDAGNIVTIGTTNSKNGIATPNSYQPVYGGNTDMYLNKFTGNGMLRWSTYIGGSQDDRGRCCSIDAGGNIYIMGQVASSNIPTTPGTLKPVFVPASPTDQDVLLAKFDSLGQNIWSTYFGGDDNEQPKSLKIDRFGSVIYISGSTRSKSGLASPDAYQKKIGGPNDAFFARINYNASKLMYASYYGGKKSESDFNHTWYGAPLEIDHKGNFILASATQSADSIAYGNSYRIITASDSAYDFFLVKFTETCFDSYESDDAISEAPRLLFDGNSNERSLKGTIQSASDIDYYLFPLADGLNSIQCSITDLPLGYNLTIFDANQTPVTISSGPPNTNGSATLNFASPGNYYVGISTNESTFDSPACYQITIKTSNMPFKYTNDIAASSASITIFPNPVNDQLTVSVNHPVEKSSLLSLTTISGQLLLTNEISAGACSVTLPVNTLLPGTYLLKIAGGHESWYGKFVKE
ncbi:MAG: T9SS type A sorting domain-containing protein [Chitinophagales bacterium]